MIALTTGSIKYKELDEIFEPGMHYSDFQSSKLFSTKFRITQDFYNGYFWCYLWDAPWWDLEFYTGFCFFRNKLSCVRFDLEKNNPLDAYAVMEKIIKENCTECEIYQSNNLDYPLIQVELVWGTWSASIHPKDQFASMLINYTSFDRNF